LAKRLRQKFTGWRKHDTSTRKTTSPLDLATVIHSWNKPISSDQDAIFIDNMVYLLQTARKSSLRQGMASTTTVDGRKHGG